MGMDGNLACGAAADKGMNQDSDIPIIGIVFFGEMGGQEECCQRPVRGESANGGTGTGGQHSQLIKCDLGYDSSRRDTCTYGR